jgi:transposase
VLAGSALPHSVTSIHIGRRRCNVRSFCVYTSFRTCETWRWVQTHQDFRCGRGYSVAADRASQKAVFTSSIAAYRWLDLYRQHGPDWFTRPPRKTRSVAHEVAGQIIAMSERHPHWGKTRIADELAARYGQRVVSATGVRSVLLDAGLWLEQPMGGAVRHAGDLDPVRLGETVREGIRLDALGHPAAAANLLERELWNRLVADPVTMRSLLREPELGSWLQRGWLHLGHALIDTGRWRSALVKLSAFDAWLADDESLPSRKQRAFQDQGPWIADGTPGSWRHAPWWVLPAGAAEMDPVILRQADLWLETQQYLALLTRDKPRSTAIDRLVGAEATIAAGLPWDVTPEKAAHYRGIVRHDRAVARIQAGWHFQDTRRDLELAIDDLGAFGNVGMPAAAWSNTARLHHLAATHQPHRAAGHHAVMQDAIERALDVATRDHSGMLRVTIWSDATKYQLAVRPPTVDDRDRIDAVAAFAIAEKLGRLAAKLRNDPLLLPLLGDHVAELDRLAAL